MNPIIVKVDPYHIILYVRTFMFANLFIANLGKLTIHN